MKSINHILTIMGMVCFVLVLHDEGGCKFYGADGDYLRTRGLIHITILALHKIYATFLFCATSHIFYTDMKGYYPPQGVNNTKCQ